MRQSIVDESENRSKAVEALEFLDGHQWADDLYNQRKIQRRPSLTINHTMTFRNRVVNNMKQQRPRIKVHPVSDATIETANVVGGLIRHIENISQADIAYDTAGSSAVDIGWGYARIIADYIDPKSVDQELKIVPIRNPFTVYMDPLSVMPAGEDADWVIITEVMKRKEYRRKYPNARNVDFIKTGGMGDDQALWETKTTIRLAEYYRITRRNETLYVMSNGMTLWADEKKALKADLDAAQVSVIETRQSYRKAVEWFRMNGQDIVERRWIDGKGDEQPIPGDYIPVARCIGNVLELNGRTRRKGMIEDLMDPARMFNYWRTAETEQLALSSKAPWVGPEGFRNGHPEWDNANQVPYSALEYAVVTVEQPDGSKTPLAPPERHSAIEVPAGFVQAAQSAQQDLMAVAGMPHEPGADSPGAVVSGVALRARQALSDIGHFQYYDNQTRFICFIGKILLGQIPAYYSAKRMQRILGEDGVPEMVAINTPGPHPDDPAIMAVKNDLTVGRYDIVMDTGPGYDSKRAEGAQAMIDLLKTPLGEPAVKAGADVILRSMDFAGASDLADRMAPQTPEGLKKTMESLPKNAQTVVRGLIQQTNQLQQRLAAAEADLKYSLTKTLHQEASRHAIEQMKDKRAERDTDADNDTKRFDTHVKSVTARDVAEIRAGAQLLNTHVEAAHNKAAAERALEASERAESGSIQWGM
jgi:hypothetical protein